MNENWEIEKIQQLRRPPTPCLSLNRILTTPSLHITYVVFHTSVQSGQYADDKQGVGGSICIVFLGEEGTKDKNFKCFFFYFFSLCLFFLRRELDQVE